MKKLIKWGLCKLDHHRWETPWKDLLPDKHKSKGWTPKDVYTNKCKRCGMTRKKICSYGVRTNLVWFEDRPYGKRGLKIKWSYSHDQLSS